MPTVLHAGSPATHQREIEKVRDEMKQTHRLFLDEQITAQGFGDFYKPAEVRLNQLVAELPKLEAEVDFLQVNKLSAADVLHEARSLDERWPKMTTPDKRKIVEALIEKIVIGDGEIEIAFSHLPTSEELCKSQQRLVALLGNGIAIHEPGVMAVVGFPAEPALVDRTNHRELDERGIQVLESDGNRIGPSSSASSVTHTALPARQCVGKVVGGSPCEPSLGFQRN